MKRMKTKNNELKQGILYSKQAFDEVSLDALGPESEEAWEKYRKANKLNLKDKGSLKNFVKYLNSTNP